MNTDTNDLLDKQEPEKRSTCRIHGWPGLAERHAPLDAAIFPQAILEWSSAAAGGQVRLAESAPAIYCLGVDESSPSRLVAASQSLNTGEQRDSAAVSAKYRLVPAKFAPAQDDSPTTAVERPRQAALSPRQIATLGHLLMHVKYPLRHSHVRSEKSSATGFQLVLNAGAMIDRLGYARGGDAYNALEEDIAALAQFVVRHEKRTEQGQWKTALASTLISRLDTGRCSVVGGVRHNTHGVRRDEQWVIEFGSCVQPMLDVRPADLSVIGGGLWAAAGRSRIDQWLALWVSGHGYDQSHVHNYRVETLGRRMRLLPDTLSHALAATAGGKKPEAKENNWTWKPTPSIQEGGEGGVSEREALMQARGYWRQIRKAVSRLDARNGIQSADWTHQTNAPDVRPSQVGRAVSRTDLVTVTRWAGVIEGVLPRAHRWVRQQWGNLLASVNYSFSTLEKLTQHDSAGVSSWAVALFQSYKDKLRWLADDGRILEADLIRVKERLRCDLDRALLFFEQTRATLAFYPFKNPRYMTG